MLLMPFQVSVHGGFMVAAVSSSVTLKLVSAVSTAARIWRRKLATNENLPAWKAVPRLRSLPPNVPTPLLEVQANTSLRGMISLPASSSSSASQRTESHRARKKRSAPARTETTREPLEPCS